MRIMSFIFSIYAIVPFCLLAIDSNELPLQFLIRAVCDLLSQHIKLNHFLVFLAFFFCCFVCVYFVSAVRKDCVAKSTQYRLKDSKQTKNGKKKQKYKGCC